MIRMFKEIYKDDNYLAEIGKITGEIFVYDNPDNPAYPNLTPISELPEDIKDEVLKAKI